MKSSSHQPVSKGLQPLHVTIQEIINTDDCMFQVQIKVNSIPSKTKDYERRGDIQNVRVRPQSSLMLMENGVILKSAVYVSKHFTGNYGICYPDRCNIWVIQYEGNCNE